MNKTRISTLKLTVIASAIIAVMSSCNEGKTEKSSVEKTAETSKFAYEKSFTTIFKHYTANANGAKIHYVKGGTGDVIVLIHGYPETWHTWHKMMPELAKNHTVIAVDMRGLGESEVTKSGYDKRNIAEDIHQLLEGLGIKKFDLVAHDWGANVGYALANAYPETVSKFAYVESAIPGFGLERAMDVANGGLWHFGFFMSPYAEMLTAGKEREFLTKWGYKGEETFQKDSIDQADIDVYIAAYTKPDGMTAGFNYYRTALDDIKYNREHMVKLKMPVLAIGGDHSFGEGVAMSMKFAADNVQSVVIKDCGHFVSEEQPAAFTKVLLDFFDKQKF